MEQILSDINQDNKVVFDMKIKLYKSIFRRSFFISQVEVLPWFWRNADNKRVPSRDVVLDHTKYARGRFAVERTSSETFCIYDMIGGKSCLSGKI